MVTMRALSIKVCSVSASVFSSSQAISLFKNHRDIIYNFIGIHPEFANLDLNEFENIFSENNDLIDGIGEIGIDPSYSKKNPKNSIETQISVFKRMLDLAEKFDKPISIHSRNSVDLLLEILSTYTLRKVCFHWFDGSEEQLFKSMDKGYYVSFSPSIFHSSNKKNLLKLAVKNKFLVETDGPVRYRGCFREVVTLPTSILVSLVYFVSEVLGSTFEDTANQICRNSQSFFEK